jgi:hypothetical protein
LNHIQFMKTTILEDLRLPEDRRAALSRESLRTGKPVAQLIREWVLAKSDRLMAAAEAEQKAA